MPGKSVSFLGGRFIVGCNKAYMKEKLHQPENESLITFGERMASLVRERGLTASALARAIGLSHVAVGNYLKGKAEPSADMLLRLADYFDVAPHWLRHGTGAKFVTGLQRAKSLVREGEPGDMSDVILKRFARLMDLAKEYRLKPLEGLAQETLDFETAVARELQDERERLKEVEAKLANLRTKLGGFLKEI